MALYLDPSHLAAMTAHAESTYPEECCGLLLGRVMANALGDETPTDSKQVVEVRSLTNTWSPDQAPDSDQNLSKNRRYWIAPADMLAAMRDARTRNLDIIGVYHSHPDHPSEPSECDRQLAWPDYSYLIIAVHQGHAHTWQSWTLDDHQTFQSENIKNMSN